MFSLKYSKDSKRALLQTEATVIIFQGGREKNSCAACCALCLFVPPFFPPAWKKD